MRRTTLAEVIRPSSDSRSSHSSRVKQERNLWTTIAGRNPTRPVDRWTALSEMFFSLPAWGIKRRRPAPYQGVNSLAAKAGTGRARKPGTARVACASMAALKVVRSGALRDATALKAESDDHIAPASRRA